MLRSIAERYNRATDGTIAACINVLVDLDPIPPEELVVMGMDPLTPPGSQKFG